MKFLMRVLLVEEMLAINAKLCFSKNVLKAKDLQGFWPLLINQFENMDLCMENERMSHRRWARKVTCLFYTIFTHDWHKIGHQWNGQWEGSIGLCVPLASLEQGDPGRGLGASTFKS